MSWGPEGAVVDAHWLVRLRSVRAAYERSLRGWRKAPRPSCAGRVAQRIAAMLPKDASRLRRGAYDLLEQRLHTGGATRTRFHDPGMSQLGFGLPYAISLQLQHPETSVFNVTGEARLGSRCRSWIRPGATGCR